MAYASRSDVERLLRTTKDRITFGSAASDHMTTTDADSFISDVESSEIDAYLAPYYSTPLSGSHTIVKNISMYLSAYEIWLAIHGSNQTIDELPPVVRAWREKAERLRDLLIEQAQNGYYLPGETLAASREAGDIPIQVTAWDWQYEEDVTFTKRDWEDLDNPRIIRGTEEVYNRVTSTETSDGYDFGSTQYVRGTDYEMDYSAGRIRRLSGSSISDGQTVRMRYRYVRPLVTAFLETDWGNIAQDLYPQTIRGTKGNYAD